MRIHFPAAIVRPTLTRLTPCPASQVAYAVCQLLLGETAAAADTLGLSPGSDIKCDRTMLAFIKVRG